jgi:predicted transposase YdaD
MREIALSDWTSGVNHARMEGREEGKIEGRTEGKIEGRMEGKMEGRMEGKYETARNMKADGEPLSRIIKYTGLTEQQIKEL